MSNHIDFTKPVQTFSGEPVEIITTGGRGQYCILGYIGDMKSVSCWTALGLKQHGSPHPLDLMNVPEPKVGYVNIYRDGSASVYDIKAHAETYCDVTDRVACVKIVYKEGQFDE